MRKRLLSIALCLCLALSLLPTAALAAGTSYESWEAATAEGVTLNDGDTITIGGVTYTYKGDTTSKRANFAITSGYDIAALAGDFIYKAGEGYILYSHVKNTATAAVTLHGARANGAILPCYGVHGDDMVYTGVNTTVTLEGASTLSDILYHQAGSTTFLGTGTLALEAGIPCDLSGAVIIEGGAQVTLGNGTEQSCTFNNTLTVKSGAKLTVADNMTLTSGNSVDSAAQPGGITVEDGGTLENNGIIQMATKTAADPGIDGEITGAGVVCFGGDSTPYINVGGNWTACTAAEVAAGKVTIDGVTYIKFSGAWVTEGSTVAIGGKTYTYKGDVADTGNSGLILAPEVSPNGGWKPLEGNLVWKAGGGYILYSYQAGRSSAAVTLHAAESAKSISLPYSQGSNPYDPVYGCDTTVTLEGTSTLSGCLNHEAGGTTFTGNGTLSLTKYLACDLKGRVIIENGAQVTLGDGTSGGIGNFSNTLTVKNGGALTVAAKETLYSGSTVENGGTLENNGTLRMAAKTAADPGITGEITGTGVVCFGGSNTPYIKANGEWLGSGGDKSSEALDLTIAPTVKTLYTAGTNGTILWEPTTSTLTFNNVTMNVTNSEGSATAVTLPSNAKVVFTGSNSIMASGNSMHSAYAFKCTGSVTFELKDGNTTLTLNNAKDTYGISTSGAVTVNNSGTLTIASKGQVMQNTISASGHAITLTGGTLDFSGKVDGSVTLGNITIPTGSTLDLSTAVGVTQTAGTTVTNNGTLKLKDGFDLTTLSLTGSGAVMVGDKTMTKLNGEWVYLGEDKTSEALDLTTAPTVKTIYKAGTTGTITYIPAAGSANAQLIFDGAHMSVSSAEGDATAVTLPITPTDVIFKGQNEISASAQTGNAKTFSVSANTTFMAQAGSKTTLNATGTESKAIFAYGGDVTLKGSGELRLAPTMNRDGQKPNGYAIHAERQTVTIEDGITIYEPRVNTDSTTDTKSGTGGILAGMVNLKAASIPADGTLDLHAATMSRHNQYELVNDGTLILPNSFDVAYINAMNLSGSGVVKIGDTYYKNVGDTWMTDITYTGLDLTSGSAPAVETTYAAGEGTVTYDPGENGDTPTLTLNNATIAPIAKEGNTAVTALKLVNAKLVLIGSSSLRGYNGPAIAGEYDSLNPDSPVEAITVGGTGSLRLIGSGYRGSFVTKKLTVTDTATVNSVGGWVKNTTENLTVDPAATLNGIISVGSPGIPTVFGQNTIAENETRSYAGAVINWAAGGCIQVDGILILTQTANFDDIKDSISGSGLVRIVTKRNNYSGEIEEWDTHRADGTIMHAYPKGLDFTLPAGDEENRGHWKVDATLEDDGYTITGNKADGYVLTLGNLDLAGVLSLPNDGKVEVELVGHTYVTYSSGTAMRFTKLDESYPCTIYGSGNLRLHSDSGSGLEAQQPLTISGGTIKITTTSALGSAIMANAGLTLSGMSVTSPSGAVIGSYGVISYDTVLADGKPAASVSIFPSVSGGYMLTFETNGGSAIAAVSKMSGTTIDLTTYVPTREGYTFSGWYSDEALTEKVTSVKLTKDMTVYAKWSAANLPFADVKADDWFYEDVAYVYESELMNGTGNSMFSPYATTTRGMIVTILYRLEGEPAVTGANPFDDVASGKYYEKAVIWAAANSIVGGYGNGKFGPEDPITREQMAAILYRYEQYKGGGFTGAWMFQLAFPDADKLSEWAYEAMCWCTMNGIVGGNSDGTLAPQGNAERCQVAAILHRFCERKDK